MNGAAGLARAAATATVALLVAAQLAAARTPVERPSCPVAAALVVYVVRDGLAYENDLVVGRDGRAALCWRRSGPLPASGRTTFVVARPTLEVLRATLERIDVEHLGPPAAHWPCCLARSAALVYRGVGIPTTGRPVTVTAQVALVRVQSMLDRLIADHEPDL